MRFYPNEAIERQAEQRLGDLEAVLGRAVAPPVPVDLLAERVLGLDFLWEPIEELPGETILGGLDARRRLIVLNQRHAGLFRDKPGLERSTKGHEMGHWDLFVDRATLDHPDLPGLGRKDPPLLRRTDSGQVAVLAPLLRDPNVVELIRRIQGRSDDARVAHAVNRYAAAISMPRVLVRAAVARIDRTRWPDLYRTAESFGVTITALKVRLEELGLLFIADRRHLYPSKAAGAGQPALPGIDK